MANTKGKGFSNFHSVFLSLFFLTVFAAAGCESESGSGSEETPDPGWDITVDAITPNSGPQVLVDYTIYGNPEVVAEQGLSPVGVTLYLGLSAPPQAGDMDSGYESVAFPGPESLLQESLVTPPLDAGGDYSFAGDAYAVLTDGSATDVATSEAFPWTFRTTCADESAGALELTVDGTSVSPEAVRYGVSNWFSFTTGGAGLHNVNVVAEGFSLVVGDLYVYDSGCTLTDSSTVVGDKTVAVNAGGVETYYVEVYRKTDFSYTVDVAGP